MFFLFSKSTQIITTDWLTPQTVENFGVGDNSWANLNNVKTDDANTADATVESFTTINDLTKVLVGRNYDWASQSIPANATLVSLDARYKRIDLAPASDNVSENLFQLFNDGGLIGTNMADGSIWENSITLRTENFTESLSVSDLDSGLGFGVRPSFGGKSGMTDAGVAVMEMRATYRV